MHQYRLRDLRAGKAPRRKIKLAVVAVFGAAAAVAVFGPSAAVAHAAGGGTTTKFISKPASITTIVAHSSRLPHGIAVNQAFDACQGFTELLPTGPCALTPAQDNGGVPTAPANVPQAPIRSTGGTGPAGKLGVNVDGLADTDMKAINGHHDTPPDQGLCVGPAGPLESVGVPLAAPANASVVIELVNDVWGVYNKAGQRIFVDSNADLFHDGNSSGDIGCTYDKVTKTYFFTEIGAQNGMYYDTNLAVINDKGYSSYDVNTSESGYCFPDFPQQGFDNHAVYITVDEFCAPSQNWYYGASVYAISKTQLVNHVAANAVHAIHWSLGIDYGVFRPATGDPTDTEYLLDSNQNAPTENALDLATVTGDKKLAKGTGPITLSLTSVRSERFSEPTAALSTGNGTTCEQTLHTDPGQPDDKTWCSVPESWLDPVDMRLEQVQYKDGLLYTSLDSSMTVGNDPTVVDGAAWFVVDPAKSKVVRQGYVGLPGTYMLMPSLMATDSGALVMGFSMTSPHRNPSTGYVVAKNGKTFTGLHLTGTGSGPHVSFSGTEPDYLRNRWGDYSRVAIDPVSGNVWLANEYIPGGAAGADTVDNWGTRLWEVAP